MSADEISTTAAGAELGVSSARIRALVRTGRLPARMIGRDYIIRRADLELVRDRKPGRPKQKKVKAKRKVANDGT